VLVADDNRDMRDYLTRLLSPRFEVEAVGDGAAALEAMRRRRPDVVVSDVMRPRLDGVQLLAAVRADEGLRAIPVVILSARAGEEARIDGLQAGADDYLVKPFDAEELRARVHTGIRILTLQERLTEQIEQLRETLANVRQLKGLLPICCYCKSIRKDEDYWQQLEGYISEHSDAEFSHGICPGCLHQAHRDFDVPV
jgi:DNA-binding response OmpR family regulator